MIWLGTPARTRHSLQKSQEIHTSMVHLHQLLDTIATIPKVSLSIRRVRSAKTNAVYKVSSAKGCWALRVNNMHADALGIDRTVELSVYQQLAEQPWLQAPVEATEHYMVHRWLGGDLFSLNAAGAMEKLAGLVNQVHACPIDLPVMDIRTRLLQLMQNATTVLPELTKAIDALCQQYQLPEQMVLCHHDWHSGNVIAQPDQLILLDWEYATLGDAAIDHACIAEGFLFSEQQWQQWCERFSISLDNATLARHLVKALSLLWHIVRSPKESNQAEQKSFLTQVAEFVNQS